MTALFYYVESYDPIGNLIEKRPCRAGRKQALELVEYLRRKHPLLEHRMVGQMEPDP